MNPIDIEYLQTILAQLLAIPSPTGYTDEISDFVVNELAAFDVKVEKTRRGAIRAILRGEEPAEASAIVTHLDTLGAQVKALKCNGRLSLVPIGHWSARFAEGARVTIIAGEQEFRGTILPLKASGHTFNEEVDAAPVGWDHIELRVDASVSTQAELVELGIEIGDFVSFDAQPEFLDNGYIISRHLDNKAGVALTLAALKALHEAKTAIPKDIHFVFTVSEEVGTGAASIIAADVANMISIDIGTSAPGQNSSEFGVTIAMADQTGPFDHHLTRHLVDLCKQNDIEYQKDVFKYYRSDCASAVGAGADVRTALATFGVDASHGYERIHMDALHSLSRLVAVYSEGKAE